MWLESRKREEKKKMSTVAVSIKYSNRAFERYFDVSADKDFVELKDEIKSSGAKFIAAGFERPASWRVSADVLKELRSRYQVTSRDLTVSMVTWSVELLGNIVFCQRRGEDFEAWHARYADLLRRGQEAYDKSDEEFAKFLIDQGEGRHNRVLTDILGFHKDESWAKEIIAQLRAAA
jgi:hypothetical protein